MNCLCFSGFAIDASRKWRTQTSGEALEWGRGTGILGNGFAKPVACAYDQPTVEKRNGLFGEEAVIGERERLPNWGARSENSEGEAAIAGFLAPIELLKSAYREFRFECSVIFGVFSARFVVARRLRFAPRLRSIRIPAKHGDKPWSGDYVERQRLPLLEAKGLRPDVTLSWHAIGAIALGFA
jgi:hypothetical protein